ncbi:hypothetical protein [Pantanalinema sp. GBBB05]|uniref:hypothetical protein n=1 Tax=Pantanalinema sp. GBBB05 TaxID=2604139 RepID=UPI001D4A2079|nr:hypothetical protein [Pantanalinema sp. GBBB05]
MHQHKFVVLVGAIALAMVGCSSEAPVNTATSPSPAASSSPTQPAPAASAAPAASQPLVAQKPTAPGSVLPGLIQSTNANERAKNVQQEITTQQQQASNPFGAVPLAAPQTPARKPVPKVTALPAGTRPGGGVEATPVEAKEPLLPSPARPPAIAARPAGIGSGSARTPGQPNAANPSSTAARPGTGGQSTPSAGGNSPNVAALPPKPATTLADGVEVSGVVNINGVPQAIVKAPNEETSRYVGVGQRLSNGRVLVKRIEMNNGSEPVVVLEENGVEVAKAVGDKPARSGNTA